MTKILCCILLLILPRIAVATDTPVLIWCLDHFAPSHSYEPGKKPYGPSVDLMQELAKRAAFQLQFSPKTPSARCFRQMQTGEADLMSNLNATKERAEFMYLMPYYERVPESLYLQAKDPRQIRSFNQLASLSLATVRDYTYHPSLMSLIKSSKRHIEISSIETGFEMLLRGRIDGLIVPTQSSLEVIADDQELHYQFKRAQVDFSVVEKRFIHIGLSKKSKHLALKSRIEQAIESMVQDGTVKRLYTLEAVHQGPIYLAEPQPQQ
ncbi:transporter substrate-binding domain-containing protein [Rheinheimera sediminis]|uniref:substrate-binding periplasmic protein n=1 Tax=Rheinheimera sp. YQF-1 TaxID=2499626 RepID=UPI000FDC9402|nr:transporter substrate-binding domain-containing protein [Rheinheimera sp. YQF-1]RVT48220.1 transporter substrate-binding domain-containing protein [Rheinheimera sp. YQF-1]